MLLKNDKGAKYFNLVKNSLEWRQTRLEDFIRPSKLQPFPEPERRNPFWKEFNGGTFENVAKKYGDYGTVSKLRKKAGSIKAKIKRK